MFEALAGLCIAIMRKFTHSVLDINKKHVYLERVTYLQYMGSESRTVQANYIASRKSDKKMSEAKLESIPKVDIDEGIFKYVLIKVFGKDDPNGSELSKIIVRGYKDCNWHCDIYERIISSCQGLGLETKCLGGGRIEHNSSNKYIKIYGYSQGFGKADHAESRKILLEKYPSYTIDISDEGY